LFKITGVLDRFERFKKGESLETLLEESRKALETHSGKSNA
jgi:hypothetical protein